MKFYYIYNTHRLTYNEAIEILTKANDQCNFKFQPHVSKLIVYSTHMIHAMYSGAMTFSLSMSSI